jgi:hypothetical protein
VPARRPGSPACGRARRVCPSGVVSCAEGDAAAQVTGLDEDEALERSEADCYRALAEHTDRPLRGTEARSWIDRLLSTADSLNPQNQAELL